MSGTARSIRILIHKLHPLALCIILLCTILMSGGCNEPTGSSASPANSGPTAPARIFAQGQILPAGGIIKLSATPGDVVSHIEVAVGDPVQAGQVLMEMQSLQVANAQLKTLQKRREDAARQRDQAIATARQQLSASELKLEQLKSKQAAARRTAELLELAKQQVEASKQVFQKLLSISANQATKEFVGELEVDRQRIQVAQAELDYARQAETQKQTDEELSWGLQAVEQERQASSEQLSAAENSQSLEILDLEIAAAVEQSATTRLVAPVDGVILAINVNPGESSLPGPQIEMANLSALVCEIEVNEMDAPAIAIGQAVTITSRALRGETLKGQVSKKFKLVGRPQLRSLNPLARADYRMVTAIVDLDSRSSEMAKNWVQLQVEAEIQTSTSTSTSPAAPAASGTTAETTQPARETL